MKAAAEGQSNALAGPITYSVTINGSTATVARSSRPEEDAQMAKQHTMEERLAHLSEARSR